MANADRISEVYKGEIWDDALQQRARDRIAWLVGHAHGRVLDVGCSQGIASLLVARAGHDVVGVDVELDRLDYAAADRAGEPAEVAARVRFVGASAFGLPFGADTFDSVLLGEVLEHLDKPEAVLDEVARVLRPGGVVAITVPFGLSPHHDHRDTFYAANLLDLVGGHLAPRSVEIVDRYLRVVATDGVADPARRAELLASVQPTADRVLLEVERAELDQREAARELVRRSRQLADRERQVERLRASLERAEERIDAHKARQRELVYQRDRWRWQFESLKHRRPLRLLVELKRAAGDPRALLRLPLTALRVLFGPAPPLPVARPERDGSTARAAADVPAQAAAEQRRALELQMQLLAPAPAVALRDLRVAGVLDTFSEQSFAPECELIGFRPDNWEAVLTRQPPHLLFVESAWRGNGGGWQYQVGTYSYAESVGLPHLSALVAWCRERGIPTVFWNKEDPVHFDKFKQAAKLFDIVLTTDADRIEQYRSLRGLRATTVEALMFAAQPRLHHPISLDAEREAVPAFGGSYYRNRHPERRAQLELLLDAARGSGLVIYDRNHGQYGESFGFPERFAPHIRGGLPYEEMVAAYRRYRVFLNANSVFASPTMFSRRVFELLACGTPVVSTPSVGMERLFGDIVDLVDDEQSARYAIERLLGDDDVWRQRSAAGIRRVHGQHTYAHRLAQVAGYAGYELPAYGDERIAVLLLADDGVDRAVDSIVVQSERPHEIVVGSAGTAPSPSDVTVVPQPADRPRADRFAELAAATDAPWVLIADSRRTYRLDLLADLAVARRWTDADVIGSAADVAVADPRAAGSTTAGHGAEVSSAAGSASAGNAPHRYVDRVRPDGLLVRRELVAAHGWDDRDGEAIQARLRSLGARLYAAAG